MDTVTRTKTVLQFYQCKMRKQMQRIYLLLSLLSSLLNSYQTKNTRPQKKREELINYESSVAALSGMPTVFLLTSQEDRRRRQDIFLHNLLASAL